MNPNLMKYGLLAVGAYFAYDWWKKREAAPGTTAPGGAAAPGTTTQPAAQPAEAQPAPTPVAPQDTAPQPVTRVVTNESADIDKLATMAAGGFLAAVETANRLGVKFNFHQWSYYRAQATGLEQPDPDTYSGGRSSQLVSVSDFLAARQAAGLQGLGYGQAGRIPPSLMWIT